MAVKYVSKGCHRSGMGTLRLYIEFFGLGNSTPCHFVRHRTREQDKQVGRTDLLFEVGCHMSKNFSGTFVLFAYLLVFSDHAVISTDYNYAHNNSPRFEIS